MFDNNNNSSSSTSNYHHNDFPGLIIRAGTVSDAQPQRIVTVPPKHRGSNSNPPNNDQSAQAAFRYWSTVLQDVYDSLGQDSKDRRVVVLLPVATLQSTTMDDDDDVTSQAIVRVLCHVIGVPAVSVQPTLALLPYALPMVATAMLVVHITATDACTFCHAKGQPLPYTLHTVSWGNAPRAPSDDDETRQNPNIISTEWTTKVEEDQFLSTHHPQSVLLALCKTLEACPMALRASAVHNLVICGEGVVYRPDLPFRIAKRLQHVLARGGKESDNDDDTRKREGPYPAVWSLVPVAWSALQSLAPRVGVIDTAATLGHCRADMLGWTGAVQWASHCHAHDPDAFGWIVLEAQPPQSQSSSSHPVMSPSK